MARAHCWTGKGEWLEDTYGWRSVEYAEYITNDEPRSTCMLFDGHDGPHVWTPDNEILITFSD